MFRQALAPKCQVLLLAECLGLPCCDSQFEPAYAQDITAQLESELADVKARLEVQESETRKADSKFQFSVAEMEKLKTSFEVERSTLAEEKTALAQRAEKAEAALQEVTTKLTGLRRHMSQMDSAIFGKSPC